MKRTIEKLTAKRQKKEKDLSTKLQGLKEKSQKYIDSKNAQTSRQALAELENSIKTKKKSKHQQQFNHQILEILKGLLSQLEENQNQTKELFASMAEMIENNSELTDAKDKEWDALSNNHVSMIFKSMEWKIDKLAANYEDASILMKKFILLKEKLNRLLAVLEKKEHPTPAQVKKIAQPLDDFQYAGFENRHRGSEADVKKQQEIFLPYFKPGKPVLDLGCGRGEFIDLLAENGIKAEGIDINEQMIETCMDKGFNCRKADILETLAAYKDGCLGGIFSSQVIEHLSPSYLKRMIELAYFKLAAGSYIVLETINPVSVFSLVQIYYLDISHKQPVHPQALKFLMESAGFDNVEINHSSPLEVEKLKELPASEKQAHILNENIDKLNELLYSPSNYAAIGIKT